MKQELFLEKIVGWCRVQYKRNRIPFLTATFVGILTYGFAFTNKLVNHDEVGHLFSKGASMSSGRWGLDLLSYVFPSYSMPWIYGILSVILMAISTCIIVDIFCVKNKILQGLLAGLIVAFPSLIGTFAYMFTASSYAVAFLFSVIAVRRFSEKSVKNKLCAVVFMILSLGIYQAYIAVSASLFLLLVLQRTIKENGKSVEIIKDGVMYVGFLGASLACYYGVTQLLLIVTNRTFNAYASSSISMNDISILSRLKRVYISFKDILINREYGLIATEASKIIHILSFAILAVEIFALWIKKKWQEKALLMIGIILLPLSINCMFLFTDAEAIHTLVLYSFVSVYVFAIIIIDQSLNSTTKSAVERCWRFITRQAVTIAMLFVVVTNIYVGNQSYLYLHLKYENAYAFYNQLITEVKMTPGFDKNSKLAMVGYAKDTIYSFTLFENIKDITGTNGFWVNAYSKNAFINYYLGFDIPFATDSEIKEIKGTPDFAEMDVYPYYGSIKKIGDYIVVKFSE